MSKSEIMTIIVIFLKTHRNLKFFYLYYVSKHIENYFPNLVSHNRFGLDKYSSFSFIDSTALKVCYYKRKK